MVAQTTRNHDLLTEAEQMIAQVGPSVQRVDMMLGLIEATATLRLRDRVTAQREHLRRIVQNSFDSQDPATSVVTRFVTARIRTMTEVAEHAAVLRDRPLVTHDPIAAVVPAPFPSRHDRPLEDRLGSLDWTYTVEELVTLCPEAYPAILGELDAIAGAVAISEPGDGRS